VSLECVCSDPTPNKERPQPGEDGYGRLVRAQQGRGGVIIRMPSNCEITRTARKSSSLRFARQDYRRVPGDRRAQFCFG
jgi:hypothetical protein